MIDVTINLLCSRKPGILSRLIRDIKIFGLIYTGHNIEYQDNRCQITINGSGELNCTRDKLEQMLNDFPGVITVTHVSIKHDGTEVSGLKTTISSEQIDPHQALTPNILLMAEKRLAETLGPISSYLVENATQNCTNCGELFAALAAELNNEQERRQFLSILDQSA
jgi:hypothetical protein